MPISFFSCINFTFAKTSDASSIAYIEKDLNNNRFKTDVHSGKKITDRKKSKIKIRGFRCEYVKKKEK